MSNTENIESFSGTMFGGFSRKDVIQYIERLSNEHEEELSARIKEIDGLKTKLAERDEEMLKLQTSLEDAERKCTESLQAITLLHAENDKQKNFALSMQREGEQLKHRIEKLQFENLDIDIMRKKLESMEAAQEELTEAKLRLANIEIEARQRADQVYKDAEKRALDQQSDFFEKLACAKSELEVKKQAINKYITSALIDFETVRLSLENLKDVFGNEMTALCNNLTETDAFGDLLEAGKATLYNDGETLTDEEIIDEIFADNDDSDIDEADSDDSDSNTDSYDKYMG